MTDLFLFGDEVVAQAALDAGISAAYAYPGTPSTEAFEYLLRAATKQRRPRASWCANEKVAVESALGVSMVGRRALAVMKHVGLNVAADPFINGALAKIHGGVVLAVADDPGMHSSQNEQDSRFYADFARVPCLEPADHHQAYAMTREAFDISERFHVPVIVRLVTRLAHTRSTARPAPAEPERPLGKAPDRNEWVLLPANARRLWSQLLDRQPDMLAWSDASAHNRLTGSDDHRGLGVITTGLARAYYLEHRDQLGFAPVHLHIGTYPIPTGKIRALADRVERVLVLEEGYPFVERLLRGVLPQPIRILGKLSGDLPVTGELTPDAVAGALGLPPRAPGPSGGPPAPPRPPQLCDGCPHRDSFSALLQALENIEGAVVTGDIGCYTLGALPPYRAIESCISMGASIGMARGAAEAGSRPVVAVIGDSTFIHSGIPPLIDAIHDDTDMTVLILDNGAVGMTGAQDTALPSSRLEPLILGLGVDPDHCHIVDAHPRKIEQLTATLRREIAHAGVSVVIASRECVVHARHRKASRTTPGEAST